MAKKRTRSADSGKAKASVGEHWGEEPQEHDYPAAAEYLNLICPPGETKRLVAALRTATIERYKAKDLLRASGLGLLPKDNAHVVSDLSKVARGAELSPVLLVRGNLKAGFALTIADGYHRVCASYYLNENADIPCHLVDLAHSGSRNTTQTRSSRGPSTVQ